MPGQKLQRLAWAVLELHLAGILGLKPCKEGGTI